jgi:hypothetical protein
MGEAVAIISVCVSGLVGLGGLASTVWAAARERRWKSREERATEFRTALETGCEVLMQLAWAVADARSKAKRDKLVSGDLQNQIDSLADDLNRINSLLADDLKRIDSLARQATIVGAQIAVRSGSTGAEKVTFEAWLKGVSKLIGIIVRADEDEWREAWAAAAAAEAAYLDATAKTLAAAD